MRRPFPRSYWVEPGRLLAGFYPGDQTPEATDGKLAGLLDCGLTFFVNLMEEGETDHSGRAFVPYEARVQELAAERGRAVQCRRFPIVDRSVPAIAGMREILDCVESALARHEVVYVHCWGGRGRTGAVVGCYLQRAGGLGGEAALARLRDLTVHFPAVFWPAPEMPGQRKFVRTWKEHE